MTKRGAGLPSGCSSVKYFWFARMVVRRTSGKGTRSGHTVARETVQGDGFEALAAAHSRALATVSGDIAGAIRAEAQMKP